MVRIRVNEVNTLPTSRGHGGARRLSFVHRRTPAAAKNPSSGPQIPLHFTHVVKDVSKVKTELSVEGQRRRAKRVAKSKGSFLSSFP